VDLNSILIGSEDPKRLAEFYTRLFGDPGWDDGGYTGWLIGSGALTVGPHSEVSGKNAEPGRVIWNIESPNVQADFERLRDAGAEVVREPYTPDGMPEGTEGWIATLADPDGNYFQLVSPMG
jgi:predicted enzyme related to lactoylglutathione lyase